MQRSNWVPGLTLVALATGVVGATGATGATAYAGEKAPVSVVVIDVPGHGQATASDNGRKTEATDPAAGSVAMPNSHDQTLSASGSRSITPPGGSAGTIKATGSTFVRVPALETSANFT